MPVNGGWRERGLPRGGSGVFRSLLWHVPFTINPPLFSPPAAGERHCAENGRCAVCSTPSSSGGGKPYREVTSCRPPTARRRRQRYRVATIFLPQCRVPRAGRNRPWVVRLSRRKQQRAESHVNGIFHTTHAPEYEDPFRINQRKNDIPGLTANDGTETPAEMLKT